jgi:hypothetical protein
MRLAFALLVISSFAGPIKAQQQPTPNPSAQQTMTVVCRDMAGTGEYLAPGEVIIDGKACRPVQTQPEAPNPASRPNTAAVTLPAPAVKAAVTYAPATKVPEPEATPTPATLSAGGETPATPGSSVAYVKCGVGGTEVYLLSSPTGAATVSTLKCGDRLLLLSEDNGWYRAQAGDGTEGYISQYFVGDSAGNPAAAATPEAENPRPVMSNVTGFQYTINFVIIQNGHAVPLMPNWAIKWVKKNGKHYPGVRFSTSDAPIPGAKNFVIAFSASSGALQGFEPVTHTDTSTSTSPVSGSGTVTDNQGEMWNYSYNGTVTATTTTTTEEQVPYTETSNTLYVTAFNEQGQTVSQRWHVFSSRTGGNPYNSLGYNLGSALSAINAKGNLLKHVVDDVVPRK